MNIRRSISIVILVGWIAALVIITLVSVAMDANRSTTGLLVTLGLAPAIVVALVMAGAPSRTVAQILYSVETKERRS